MFLATCREHLSEEPALFLLALSALREETHKGGRTSTEIGQMLRKIYQDFVKPDAVYAIPLSARVKRLLIQDLGPPEDQYTQKWPKRLRKKLMSGKIHVNAPLRPLPEDKVRRGLLGAPPSGRAPLLSAGCLVLANWFSGAAHLQAERELQDPGCHIDARIPER